MPCYLVPSGPGVVRSVSPAAANRAEERADPESALAGYYRDDSFATGVIARLATGTGRLEWSCAGHPRPPLLRGRKVVAELSSASMLPFGLCDRAPAPGIEELEPDDAVLLYTDGVTEARAPDGELFGTARLADLLEREATSGRTAEELLRRLVQALLEHQAGGLRDDATPAAGAVDRYLTRLSGR